MFHNIENFPYTFPWRCRVLHSPCNTQFQDAILVYCALPFWVIFFQTRRFFGIPRYTTSNLHMPLTGVNLGIPAYSVNTLYMHIPLTRTNRFNCVLSLTFRKLSAILHGQGLSEVLRFHRPHKICSYCAPSYFAHCSPKIPLNRNLFWVGQ